MEQKFGFLAYFDLGSLESRTGTMSSLYGNVGNKREKSMKPKFY